MKKINYNRPYVLCHLAGDTNLVAAVTVESYANAYDNAKEWGKKIPRGVEKLTTTWKFTGILIDSCLADGAVAVEPLDACDSQDEQVIIRSMSNADDNSRVTFQPTIHRHGGFYATGWMTDGEYAEISFWDDVYAAIHTKSYKLQLALHQWYKP
jgi:hypothetical protein